MKQSNILQLQSFYAIVLTVWLFLGIALSPVKAQSSLDAEAGTRQFFEAVIEKNLTELSLVLATDFTIIGMDGHIVDRETFISSIKDGYISVQTGIVDGIRVKNYLEVSTVSGRWNIQANIANSRYFGDVSFLSVCVKKGGLWKIATIHFTPII